MLKNNNRKRQRAGPCEAPLRVPWGLMDTPPLPQVLLGKRTLLSAFSGIFLSEKSCLAKDHTPSRNTLYSTTISDEEQRAQFPRPNSWQLLRIQPDFRESPGVPWGLYWAAVQPNCSLGLMLLSSLELHERWEHSPINSLHLNLISCETGQQHYLWHDEGNECSRKRRW